jgi:choline dehydrogenase-like flavoprotein
MQVIPSRKVHPVIVVGSGASGGMAAWNLTRKGVDVLLLDAGDRFEREHVLDARPALGGARAAGAARGRRGSSSTRRNSPTSRRRTSRSSSFACGATAARPTCGAASACGMSDLDFQGPARDGWEIPWPITYKDVAPYYDQVDQLIGVCGGSDDSEVLPGSKYHLPPPAPRCGERLLWKAFDKVEHPDRADAAREHDAPGARLPRLPLLRQLRARVRHGLVLQLGRSPAAVRAEDGPARAAVQRGRRARPRERQGARRGRAVLRPEDRQGRARLRQGRRDGRERGRHDAHPAQLEVTAAPERHRQRRPT